MPKYSIKDPVSGKTIVLTGDSPPTEQELKDIFAELMLSDPARKPASAEDFAEPAPASDGFLTNAARAVLPSTTASDYVKGPAYAAMHPIEALKLLAESIGGAHAAQAGKTAEAARGIVNEPTIAGKAASASRMLGHGLATVLPLVGPAAATAGEQIGSGDVAGGLGTGAGLLAGVVGPRVAQKAGVSVRGLGPTKNPKLAESIAFAEREGIEVDPATATGRPILRRIQKRVGDTMGGSGVTERFQQRQQQQLADTGRRLATKADPNGPSSPISAGAAMQDGVRGRIGELHGEATKNYDVVRAAEADPSNLRTITREIPEDAPSEFSSELRPSAEQIFRGVLKDARENGYKGSIGELREKFLKEYKGAQSLRVDTAQTLDRHGPEALLRDIRKYGGLRPFDKESGVKFRSEYESIQQGFSSHTSGWHQRGGAQIFRNNGLSLDGMVEALRQDAQWAPMIESTNDLLNVLDDISRSGPSAEVGDIQHFMGASGVRPGAQWWKPGFGSETMPLPVDLRDAKAALRPIYQQLTRQYPITQRQASAGFQALQNIVDGPDYAPLTQVEQDLGAVKSIARGKNGTDLPELASVSQGLAKQAIDKLDATIRTTAAGAGRDTLPSLLRGRKATALKFDAGRVLDKMREEPVQTFNQATFARDAGVKQLEAVAHLAPESLPKVGRAYLDDLIDKATNKGRFERADGLLASWTNLGAETKKLLFNDPEYIRDLDSFFRLAAEVTNNPNPSGTAGQMTAVNVASAIPMKIASKMLYSRRGIKLLINGFRLKSPVSGRVAAPASTVRPRPGAPASGSVPAMADKRDEDPTLTVRR
jgi:hypothetical protein